VSSFKILFRFFVLVIGINGFVDGDQIYVDDLVFVPTRSEYCLLRSVNDFLHGNFMTYWFGIVSTRH
jgi:hypothetical protein